MSDRSHPSLDELQHWLVSSGDDRVGLHVDRCEQCQGALEEISGLDDELVADLATVLAAPVDIERRTEIRVAQRLRDEEAVGVFLDLFGIGWSVLRTITDPSGDCGEEDG